MKFKLSAAVTLLMSLGACSNQSIDDYADKKLTMSIKDYLNGNLEADGVLFDYAGRQDRRFHVDMVGSWNGDQGTLQESFLFDDGQTQKRTWNIQMIDQNHFKATAADVVGEAKGSQNGNTLNMHYTLRIPRGSSSIDIVMDDWIYLIDEHTAVNKTTMHKFGFKVGELMIVFRKK